MRNILIPEVEQAIKIMQTRIVNILQNTRPSVYLYGSIALKDFKPGWSDIDVQCLTEKAITEEQAGHLLNLRQELKVEFPGNKYFGAFEGGMLALSVFLTGSPGNVVYWGSKGQSIADRYNHGASSFTMAELIESSILLYGDDVRDQLQYPTLAQLRHDIDFHLDTIRKHAVKTGRSIYSAGWLFDISRRLYTLRTGKIIAKTVAGKWAFEHNLCPDAEILGIAIKAREEPEKYKDDLTFLSWCETLGPPVQRFADVLESELRNSNRRSES